MSKKAELLLGLNKGGGVSTTFVQAQGTLLFKEDRGAHWKKRFCVVKDGFFLWYKSAPGDIVQTNKLTFDRKPMGILPLNGAFIQLDTSTSPKTQIELTHIDIIKANFLLMADSEAEALEWEQRLHNGQKATWENAELGAALLEKMKAEGTKLEEEKERAVQELQQKAKKLSKVTEDKLKLLSGKKEQAEKFEKKVGENQKQLEEKEGKKLELEKQVRLEEERVRTVRGQRKQLESTLGMANLALRRLENAFEGYFEEGWKNVTLRSPRRQPSDAYSAALNESQAPTLRKRPAASSEDDSAPPPLPPLPPQISQTKLQEYFEALKEVLNSSAEDKI